MKKPLFAFTLILFAAWLGLAMPNYQSEGAGKKAAKTISGEVISATANEIVIKDGTDTEAHLMVDNATRITRDGNTIALGDVKVGEVVTAECEDSGGSLKAKSIRVTSLKPKQ
jgi:type 1 fimbria pilin